MAANAKQKIQAYDRFKQYQGKAYSGMRVGATHRWHYEQGEWRERKLSPEEWEIFYQTVKRRAFRAPEESGAPIGTEYNWLIVSHQRVDKLDANSYMTRMEGKKFKVAHKRAGKDAWNASERAQRKKVIQYLEQMIAELKQADASADLPYSVGEHEHVYGLNLRTKDELLTMAKDYDIPVTSSMKRAELLQAVKEQLSPGEHIRIKNTKSNGHDRTKADGVGAELQSKTKTDLYKLAGIHHIGGRSHMNKAELMRALTNEIRRSGTTS
jgi:hypothetical protein